MGIAGAGAEPAGSAVPLAPPGMLIASVLADAAGAFFGMAGVELWFIPGIELWSIGIAGEDAPGSVAGGLVFFPESGFGAEAGVSAFIPGMELWSIGGIDCA